jgi:hypothetical protein
MFEASLRCAGAPSGARRAARRLTAALRTLADVLPRRAGYDVGPQLARAVLRRFDHAEACLDVAGIAAAGTARHGGNVKLTSADHVAAHVLRAVVRPRLWGADLPLFDTVLRDIFTPRGEAAAAHEPPQPHDYWPNAAPDGDTLGGDGLPPDGIGGDGLSLDIRGQLSPTQPISGAGAYVAAQIADAVAASRCCTVLGSPGSGKTTAVRRAAAAMGASVRTIFPSALGRGFLLGG